MFKPDDLVVRGFRSQDQGEAKVLKIHSYALLTVGELLNMISFICRETENSELRRQIKLMFLDPKLWILAGFVICAVGITLE